MDLKKSVLDYSMSLLLRVECLSLYLSFVANFKRYSDNVNQFQFHEYYLGVGLDESSSICN